MNRNIGFLRNTTENTTNTTKCSTETTISKVILSDSENAVNIFVVFKN